MLEYALHVLQEPGMFWQSYEFLCMSYRNLAIPRFFRPPILYLTCFVHTSIKQITVHFQKQFCSWILIDANLCTKGPVSFHLHTYHTIFSFNRKKSHGLISITPIGWFSLFIMTNYTMSAFNCDHPSHVCFQLRLITSCSCFHSGSIVP